MHQADQLHSRLARYQRNTFTTVNTEVIAAQNPTFVHHLVFHSPPQRIWIASGSWLQNWDRNKVHGGQGAVEVLQLADRSAYRRPPLLHRVLVVPRNSTFNRHAGKLIDLGQLWAILWDPRSVCQ